MSQNLFAIGYPIGVFETDETFSGIILNQNENISLDLDCYTMWQLCLSGEADSEVKKFYRDLLRKELVEDSFTNEILSYLIENELILSLDIEGNILESYEKIKDLKPFRQGKGLGEKSEDEEESFILIVDKEERVLDSLEFTIWIEANGILTIDDITKKLYEDSEENIEAVKEAAISAILTLYFKKGIYLLR